MDRNVLWEGAFRGTPMRIVAIEYPQHTDLILETISSGVVKNVMEGIWSFAKAHPFLTGWMAGMAWDAVKKYNQARKDAMYLYAADPKERSKYEDMIKELRKVGFVVVEQGYTGGTGYRWRLNKA